MSENKSVFSLQGKRGLVIGLANEHSIAYGCALVAHQLGAELMVSCVNQKAEPYVKPLADQMNATLVTCNVEEDGALESLVAQAVAQFGQLDFVIHSDCWHLWMICMGE